MSGRGTSTDTGVPRTTLERLRAGELTRGRGPFATMTPDQRLQSVARAMFDRGELGAIGLSRPIGITKAITTRTVGTQTDDLRSALLQPTRNKNAVAATATSGPNYLSFLQKVYGAESERELVIKFQKELGLEPQGLFKKPIMYRQSTQIMKGMGFSRDPCHFSSALF